MAKFSRSLAENVDNFRWNSFACTWGYWAANKV